MVPVRPDVRVWLMLISLLLIASWLSRRAALSRRGVHPSLHGALSRSSTAAYVINLHRRADRVNDFLHHYQQSDLHDLGLPVTVVPAVDGRQVDVERMVTPATWRQIQETERSGQRREHGHMTRGAVGCAMSHLDCLRRFLDSDKHYALLFEDDAVLMFRIGAAIQQTLDTARAPWDVLLLGYWCVQCTSDTTSAFYGLQGYMVTREGARKILDGCSPPFEMQLDHKISWLGRRGRLRIARAAASLVPQVTGAYGTDIQTPMAPQGGKA